MNDQPKYTPIPSAAIGDDLITDAVFRTYAKLVKLAWRHDFKFTDWLTVPYLCQYLGMDRATILRHIGQVKGKLLDWRTDGKNRYRFSILEVRLPEVAKSPLCDPSSSGINIDTLTDIEPLLPPAKSQVCDPVLIFDQDAYNALRDAGICEPARTELANLPHVTASYVRAKAAEAKRERPKIGIGALIHRIRMGWPAPEVCPSCGGLDCDHTSDCPTRPARPAGDLTAADRMRIERPQPEPESPTAAIWHQVLDELCLQLEPHTFAIRLQHTSLISMDDGACVVRVHNAIDKDWLDNRLRKMIERSLAGVVGHPITVRFVLNEEQHESIPNT